MAKCWASAFGGCSPIQSGEHYLSESLWDSEEITVKGLWGSEEKTISLGSLTVNALCRTHNRDLSELDTGIRKISDTISELHRLAKVRASIGKGKLSNIPKLKVDGKILERWAAKFLVGLFCAVGKKSYWHETKSGALDPPESIVKSIYGLEPFVEPVGLYLAYAVGDSHYHESGVVRTETLMHPDGGLVGANLDLNGFRFLVWLIPETLHASFIKSSAGTLFGPGAAELMYHPREGVFKASSQRLIFDWN
jgi:hypothetical protein